MICQIAVAFRRARIVPDLDRRAHRRHDHDALQVDRQRGDGEFDVLEFLPRLRPFAQPGVGKRLPQLRIVFGADRRVGEILQSKPRTPHQGARNRMHDQRNRIFQTRLGIRQRKIEHALGFRIHRARQIEAGQIDPRRRALVGFGRRRSGDQRVLARDKACLLVPAPFLDVENRPHRGRRAIGGGVGRRQRQAAGPAEDDLVGCNLDGDIVGVRMNRDAVDRFQQRHLDKILPLDEAANRRRRRHHDQGIAHLGIDEPVQTPRIGQRHRDLGMRRIGDVSGRRSEVRSAPASYRRR